jgi:polyhydroxyalkanoate synthesis regulator phasin
MTNLLKKSLDMGFGLFAYSRDKIESMVDELVGKGEVARKDAQEFAKDLVKKGEEQREEIKKMIRDEIKVALDFENLAKKDDVRAIIHEEIHNAIKEEFGKKKD